MQVAPPSDEEIARLHKDLFHAGKPVLLSLVPEYSDHYIPLCASGVMPNPLTDLFSSDNLNLSYPDLLKKCEEVFKTYTITADVAKHIEEKTQDQAQSKLWFQQRAGRVTASRLKAAVCTNITQPSHSLIKAVCYPESTQFKSNATAWGCQHEEQAYREYKRVAQSKHTDFSISKSGLVIHESYPLMGASPDGIINCVCCGYGVLEIKCPYSCRDTTLKDKSADSTFFLKDMNGDLSLSVYHAHYYQVQAQLKFCNAQYSDFVVFTRNELFVQRIYPDEPFITLALEKCKEFIKVGVLPELLAKFYSKEPVSSNLPENCNNGDEQWCYCREVESGEMIGCDNPDCRIQWFHTACLRITRIPKGNWYCPECHKERRKNK